MTSISFVLSQEQFFITQLLELGAAAEQAGFDGVWTSDHFHPWQDNQGHSGQAWITLAALGQRTKHITMGTGVTCPSYRYHPAIVAQSFASLGNLYPGRVFLGVGAGEAINEQTVTNDWGNYQERAERMIEAVTLIRKLWSGEWVNFTGKFFQTRDIKLYDPPKQKVPLYIAAAGEKSLHIAGQYGDGLVTDAKSAIKPETKQALDEGARKAGKDPRQLTIHAESFICVGTREEARKVAQLWRFIPKAFSEFVENPDPRDIQRKAEKEVEIDEAIKDWVIGEDANTHIQSIQQMVDAGVTHIYVHSAQADQQRVIDFFGKEVLPKIKHQRMAAATR